MRCPVLILIVILILKIFVFLLGFPGSFHDSEPGNVDDCIAEEDEKCEDNYADVGGEIAHNDGELNLEHGELPRCPDMGRCLKPFDFTANDAVDEEAEEGCVYDHGRLDDPHRDPCDVLKDGRVGLVSRRRGECAADEECKKTCITSMV